ncbi:MAG TPA: hypothetical protein ENI76_04315 [Ignavibacteria bacterium]|nr:hypothetical protein [Ignavibacteria bacterium]
MGVHSDYTKVSSESDFIHVSPSDIEQNYANIMRILNNQKNNISEKKKMRIRNENIILLQGRLKNFSESTYYRAFETIKNLRE